MTCTKCGQKAIAYNTEAGAYYCRACLMAIVRRHVPWYRRFGGTLQMWFGEGTPARPRESRGMNIVMWLCIAVMAIVLLAAG